MKGVVWGTSTYTADSSVCAAALHAGVIGNKGGTVAVQATKGCSSYQGSTNNGIRSSDYGPWEGAFFFPKTGNGKCGGTSAQAASGLANCPGNYTGMRGTSTPQTCVCTPAAISQNASVWGSKIYTEDSSVCRAAQHAGAITVEGGPVVTQAAAGCSRYVGSSSNGVVTSDYGPWQASFFFPSLGSVACP